MTSITHSSIIESGIEDSYQEPDHGQRTEGKLESNGGRSLSAALRIFGACAVIASISLFLIEGWTDGNDLNRYMKLLAQTGLITGAGIFLSFIVKEAKGARVFFGLGLVSAVANFTILGALTYSMFQLDSALGDNYHSMLHWQAVSIGQFVPLALGAIALLSLLSLFSFSIFARKVAPKLTVSFLVICSLLLVPAREAMFAAALAGVALFAATRVTLGIVKSKEILLTLEAKYALACLFLPGSIIIVRALGLYAVDELVLLTLFSLIYYGLKNVTLLLSSKSALQSLLTIAQYVAGIIIGCLIASLIPHQFDSYSTAVFSAILIGITLDLVKQPNGHEGTVLRALVSITTFCVIAINVIYAAVSYQLLVKVISLVSISAVLLLILHSAKTIQGLRAAQLLAFAGLAATVLITLIEIVSLLHVGCWVLIGGLGITLIIIASLFDKYGFRLKLPSNKQAA